MFVTPPPRPPLSNIMDSVRAEAGQAVFLVRICRVLVCSQMLLFQCSLKGVRDSAWQWSSLLILFTHRACGAYMIMQPSTPTHPNPCFLLPLSFSKLLCRLMFKAQNAAEDSFPFILSCFFFGRREREKYLVFISLLARHQTSWWRQTCTLPGLPCNRRRLSLLFVLQRSPSCRWQSKSPDSRWRRSSAWMITGVSASPGAPPEPRRAKKRTSRLPVSALQAALWGFFCLKLCFQCPFFLLS